MLVKGHKGSLDRIQIPTALLYYLATKLEVYHYDNGVFEVYPESDHSTFFPHHTIKVLAPEAVRVDVSKGHILNQWVITDVSNEPLQWVDVIQQSDKEKYLLQRIRDTSVRLSTNRALVPSTHSLRYARIMDIINIPQRSSMGTHSLLTSLLTWPNFSVHYNTPQPLQNSPQLMAK
jgi:hypothetical protein